MNAWVRGVQSKPQCSRREPLGSAAATPAPQQNAATHGAPRFRLKPLPLPPSQLSSPGPGSCILYDPASRGPPRRCVESPPRPPAPPASRGGAWDRGATRTPGRCGRRVCPRGPVADLPILRAGPGAGAAAGLGAKFTKVLTGGGRGERKARCESVSGSDTYRWLSLRLRPRSDWS